MKTVLQRSYLFITLVVIGLTIGSGLFSLFPSKVYADATTFTSMNSEKDKAVIWTELAAISNSDNNCTENRPGTRTGTGGPNATDPSTWMTGTVSVGMHVDGTDGALDCSNESGINGPWLTDALNKAGYSGKYGDAFDAASKSSSGFTKGLKDLLTKAIFPAGQPGLPDDVRYYIAMQAFQNKTGSGCAAISKSSLTPDQQRQYTDTVNLQYADPTTGQVTPQPWMYKNPDTRMDVGYNVTGNPNHNHTYSCSELAGILGNAKYANAFGAAIAAGTIDPGTSNPAGSTGSAADASTGCDFNGDPFTWFLCPVVDMLEGLIQKVDNFITESLTFNTQYFFQGDVGYHEAWNSFRLLATGILIIAGLAMITAQALGLEILDAYTIKKILPRLLIAIIGISLSWPLMYYAIDFFNALGLDIRNLIYSPFSSVQGNIGAGAAGVLVSGGIIGIWALGPAGVLSFLATAALSVLVGFIIIMVRYLALMIIIILAPIAIAAYVLPNTQKLWNLWKDNFLGLLLVFPIISAFIAIGKVFSAVSLAPTGAKAFGGQTIMQIVGLAAYFLPYFLLPIAFRLATGVIGSIAGMVNDRHKGAFDRLKGFRQHSFQEHGGRKVEGMNRRVLQKRSDIAAGLQSSASKGGRVRRAAMGFASRQVGGYNVEAKVSAKNAQVSKEMNDQIATGRDDEIRALTVNKRAAMAAYQKWRQTGSATDYAAANKLMDVDSYYNGGQEDGERKFRTLAGATVSEGAVDAAYSRWGKDAFAQQTALSYEMRKASSEEEIQSVASRYATVAQGAGGWGMSDRQAGGAWIGGAFENQNSHLEYKAANWKTGGFHKDDGTYDVGKATKFVNEVYEKKGSYPLAQMGSNTVEQLKIAHEEAVKSGDTDLQKKIYAISETFMHEAGGVPGPGGAIRDTESGQVIGDYGTVGGKRQVGTPGAAHVSERAWELAHMTGALAAAPKGMYGPGHAPTPNARNQKT